MNATRLHGAFPQKDIAMTLFSLTDLRRTFASLCVALALLAPATAAQAEEVNLEIAGRVVHVIVPASANGKSAPMMLLLHGGLGNSGDFQSKLNMAAEAEANGFVAVYLNGTAIGAGRSDRRTWNAGSCCGAPSQDGVDDVAFISQVILGLSQAGYGDARKVVLVGHSNGAMMALRYACTRPVAIRGVVALAGTLTISSCPKGRGVSILAMTGSRDRIVPVDGGGKGDLAQDEPFVPLSETVRLLEAGGASVSVQILNGASHNPSSLNSAAKAQLGQSLAQIAAGFLMGF